MIRFLTEALIIKLAVHNSLILMIVVVHVIEPPKKDRKRSMKNKNKNNRSLSFHFDFFRMSVCGDVCLSGYSDVPLYLTNYSLELIYMHISHHENDLNEGIKMMCFICRFNVYFSRNQRKCSQNGEDGSLKV